VKDHVSLPGVLPGWTLAEVLIAMSIVFLLSGTVGIAGKAQIDRARDLAAEQQLAALRIALECYAADTGEYPTTEQGLAALMTIRTLSPVPAGWRGPYLSREVPSDPWGKPYEYRADSTTQERGGYTLSHSAGGDG
jgi:general secretion pathway protein G